MKDFLAIIRKSDFIDLYKYGHLNISYAVPFDGDIKSHQDDNELFDNLTKRMNMYEYSFEYLIIHFIADEINSQCFSVKIKNLRNLYTLDEEAKREMSISFDPRIQIHISPWDKKFERLQQMLTIKQSMKGIENLWTIYNLSESDLTKCKEIISENVIQEVFREFFANERPTGEQSIWTYLLRYERHCFYPKTTIGYFYDLIHVFCNYSKKTELDGEIAERTEIYQNLKSHIEEGFTKILPIVVPSTLYKKTEQITGCRFCIVAPLFLLLKQHFANGLEYNPEDKIVMHAKKIGGFEFSIAIYLLGITLGYDKTYDAFYNAIELPIFKKKEITKEKEEIVPTETIITASKDSCQEDGVQGTIFNDEVNSEPNQQKNEKDRIKSKKNKK